MAALAWRQHGVVTRAQLRGLGLSDRSVDRRLAVGRLHPVWRGVFAVGHPGLSPDGRRMAAVLAVGAGAVLSHRSAAALWNLPVREPGLEVTSTRRVRDRPALRVHFARALGPRASTSVRGIPVTTPIRTLVDLAGSLDEPALRRATRQAEVLRLVDSRTLVAAAAGRPGAVRLARLAADEPTPTHSELEDRALELLARHGLPRPEVNVALRELGAEVDLLFRAQRVAIECDGARVHDTRLVRRDDARRQARLEAAGYRVLRVSWEQVTREANQTAARIRLALAAPRPGDT